MLRTWVPLTGFVIAAAVAAPGARAAAPDAALPPASPPASVSQQVGITMIRVDYARVAAGAEVPLATQARPAWPPVTSPIPRITFNRELEFLGVPVAAGSYVLLAIPGPDDWIVVLNRDVYLASTARYRPDLEVVRRRARVQPGPRRDRLEFTFSDFDDEGGTLRLAWGGLRVDLPIRVHTRQQIETQLAALDDGWRWYADAADYLAKVRHDAGAGLRYADQSIALQRNAINSSLREALLAARAQRPGRGSSARPALPPARPRESASEPRLAFARQDAEDRVFHATIEPALTGGLTGGERTAPPRRAIAPKPPSATEIGAVIKRGRTDLQSCYQRALRQDPALTQARVEISIDVGVSGTVKNIRLTPAHPPAALEACIRSSVAGWVFPPSTVDYQAELPLVVHGRD